MRYTVDAFTLESEGSKHLENSWWTDSAEEVGRIIYNCARNDAGISLVEVRIDAPHDEPALEQECPECHEKWRGFYQPHKTGCKRRGES